MPTIVRSPKVKTTNFSLDVEARLILDRLASSPKAKGHLMSRLLHELRVRLEEQAARDADYKELQRLYNLPVREERVATIEQ